MISGQMLRSINPATGECIGEVPVSTPEEIKSAVAAARAAQPEWQSIGIEGRVFALRKLCDDFTTHRIEFAKLIAREMGSPVEANLKVMDSRIEIIRWNLDNAAHFLAPETTFEDAKKKHQIFYEPYGVFGIIVPWNVPFSNFVRTAIQPLVAGNTVVFKMSEEVPLFGKALDAAFHRAHIPAGVFSQIYGAGDAGEAMVKSSVNHIHFTGSTAVGRKLYKIAAEEFIPVTLELGGSDPGIVFEDADLERVIPAIFRARFGNSGQVCSALKRLLAHESRYEELTKKLGDYIRTQKIGDPLQSDTVLGPLVSEKQKKLLEDQVADAKAKGVTVVFDDKSGLPAKGAYFEPMILSGLKPDMRASHEELFGPVLTVATFKTEEEAVRMANDTEYGLSAYVYTEDRERFQRVASQIRAGTVSHNGVDSTLPANPFGGFKYSGLGRSGGRSGLRSCCQIKVVAMEKE